MITDHPVILSHEVFTLKFLTLNQTKVGVPVVFLNAWIAWRVKYNTNFRIKKGIIKKTIFDIRSVKTEILTRYRII